MEIDKKAIFLLSHTKVKRQAKHSRLKCWVKSSEGKNQQSFGSMNRYKTVDFYLGKDLVVDGELKRWAYMFSFKTHCFFKDDLFDGEFKDMTLNGEIISHYWYNGGKNEIDFLKNPELKEVYKLKEGFVLGSDGEYYPDK